MKRDFVIDTIADAFLALNEIDDEEVADMIKPRRSEGLNEGRTFNLNGAADELKEAEKFLHDKGKTETEIEVIDPDADTIEHIKSKEQYVGQAILQCVKCGAKRFIDLDKLQVDPQDPDIYNLEDECPNCKTSGDGYELIGQVGKVRKEETIEEEPENAEELAGETPIEEVPEEASEPEPAEPEALFTLKEEPMTFENDSENEEEEDLDLPAYESKEDKDEEEKVEEELEKSEEKKEKPKLKLRIRKAFTEEVCPKCGKVECECLNEEVDWSRLKAEEEDAIDSYQREINRAEGEDEVNLLRHIQKEEEEHKAELLAAEEGNYDPIEETYCKDAVREAFAESEWPEKAWMLGQIIQCMNDEEAYYGSWLYTWPDGATFEDCKELFDDEESYRDLEDAFINTYKAYHNGGLYNAPEAVEKAAHEWDRDLGLAPIENIRYVHEAVEEDKEEEEDDSPITVQDLLDCIIEPENIDTIIVNKDGEEIFDGVLDDMPEKLFHEELVGFNTAQSKLCINVDNADDSEDVVEDFLTFFNDEDTDRIIITDVNTSEAEFEGTKAQVLEKYDDAPFVSIEAPECLQIFIGDMPEDEEPEEVEESVKKNNKPCSLFEDICKANGLATYRVNDPKTAEHWINEALTCETDEYDQKLVYEKYVKGHGKDLETRYKKTTGYREIFVESLDEDFDDFDTKVQSDELAPDDYEEREEILSEPSTMSKGFVRTRCAECGKLNKVEVTFPAWNEPFLDTTYKCVNCGTENKLSDPHEYNEDGTVVEESCKVEEKKSNCSSYHNREELAEAIAECKKNNRPFRVKRSVNPDYRYDLEVDEALPTIATAAIAAAASGAGSRIVDKLLGEEKVNEDANIVPSQANSVANKAENHLETVSEEDRVIIQKIQKIAGDICDAIQDVYGIDANPAIVAADIMQDLKLIGGAVDVRDLADTPINRMTAQMFDDFNSAADAINEIMFTLTGKELNNTPAAKLNMAIRMLDTPAFAPENIRAAIESPRFLAAARAGAVPYITGPDQRLLEGYTAKDEVDFDTKEFDKALNEHFADAYAGEVLYTTNEGYVTEKGKVILKGILEGNNLSRPVTFTLTPKKALTEDLTTTEDVVKALDDMNFMVTNDLSDETFLYGNNTKPCVYILADDRTVQQVIDAFDKEFKDMPMDESDRIECIANWEFINHMPYYREKGLDESHIKNALLINRDVNEGLESKKTIKEFFIPNLKEKLLIDRWAELNDIDEKELDIEDAPKIAKDLMDIDVSDLVEADVDYDEMLAMVKKGFALID